MSDVKDLQASLFLQDMSRMKDNFRTKGLPQTSIGFECVNSREGDGERKERLDDLNAARCGGPYGELAAKEESTYIIPRP